jgi:RNA-directed DNA polymerase
MFVNAGSSRHQLGLSGDTGRNSGAVAPILPPLAVHVLIWGDLGHRTREITRRNRGVSMEHRYRELRRCFQGWVGCFGLVPINTFFSEMDKWVRRRLRSCHWKQWRRPRTRIANLRKLGIKEEEAVTHGCSSKGPWGMSASQAVHQALSLEFFTQSALPSLCTLWSQLAPKYRTA